MQVVDHECPRSTQLGEPAHVALDDLAEVEPDLGRVGGCQVRLGLPAAERRLARHEGDAPGVAARLTLVDVIGEQEAPGERPRVGPRLVGQALGERPGEAIRLAGRVRQVLHPRPGEAELARLLLEVRHESGLADARVADHDHDVAVARGAGLLEGRSQAGTIRGPADEQPLPGGTDESMQPRATQAADPDRRGPPADAPLAHDLDVETVPGGAHARFVQERFARLGQLLETHRGGDRLARHREVAGVADGSDLGDHLAGRDADPQTQRRLAPDGRRAVERRGHLDGAEDGPDARRHRGHPRAPNRANICGNRPFAARPRPNPTHRQLQSPDDARRSRRIHRCGLPRR